MGEQPGVLVNYLRRDTPDSRGHHGLFLPKRFRYGEAKSFTQTLLDDDGGSALKSVDLQRSPRREFQNFNVGIAGGGVPHLFQDFRAFRIVGGGSASQDQLTIEIAFDNLISANHPDGILKTVKAGDLREYGPKRIDVKAGKHIGNKLRREVAVFFGERINRGVEKILGNGELASKFRGGKDRTVVMGNIRLQKLPNRTVGVGEIDVAAPDPVRGRLLARGDQGRGLRIMNYNKFRVEREAMEIQLSVGAEYIKMAGLGVIRRAVESVVERLGNLEEILAARHDVPTNAQAEFFREGHEAVENFGHTSADGRGIDHFDGAPV